MMEKTVENDLKHPVLSKQITIEIRITERDILASVENNIFDERDITSISAIIQTSYLVLLSIIDEN